MKSSIKFSTFPQTEPPPEFVPAIISVFETHEPVIATLSLEKGLTSDGVLGVLREDLIKVGFDVEGGKRRNQRIERPVFYGENGFPQFAIKSMPNIKSGAALLRLKLAALGWATLCTAI